MTARPGPARGVVVGFDDGRGLGVVALEGGDELTFHATQVAGGARRVAPGTPVRVVVRPGQRGRLEAGDVEPEGPPPAPSR